MTNPIIPHAFIPGTKAKANEVNENFLSLAAALEKSKTDGSTNLNNLSNELTEKINLKSDKTELLDVIVDTDNPDLNTYKTKGNYIFSEEKKPSNSPCESSGILIVVGTDESALKQIWFSDGELKAIYTRAYNFVDEEWEKWLSIVGERYYNDALPGFLKLPNGLVIQWGCSPGATVTYPIAYNFCAHQFATKYGVSTNAERSDTGFADRGPTGHRFIAGSGYTTQYWLAIGLTGEIDK